ncbi:diacylglycerol kinase [Patescibacteria group bacterium]|nr:diacylglycerol kinase [Patescibacteria group bacterium]MBU2159052.1 diacylglycerol kinase [Patescibacteria group bacterium]MBU2220513.1 diacylglycerol kinase [Patescibacteria group bacterium]
MKFWIKRLSHPIRGLKHAFAHDFAVRCNLALGIVGIPASYFLFGPFSPAEVLLLIFCWFFVVVTELQNSAIETALDKVHPEHHSSIGLSKDLAAGAVVWAAVFGLVSFGFVLSGVL